MAYGALPGGEVLEMRLIVAVESFCERQLVMAEQIKSAKNWRLVLLDAQALDLVAMPGIG